jgi:hypothetical protein
MSRLRAVVAALTLGVPFAAGAADVTRVATSFEDDDPFGLYIDMGFEQRLNRSKILREQLPNAEGGPRQYSEELWYRGTESRLNLNLAVGIFRDLQLTFGMPIIFRHDENWKFVAGTSELNSSIINNCVRTDGSPVPGCDPTTGTNRSPLFAVPSEVHRGGLGNMRFGLHGALFNQRKDETKPTWVVGLDYEAPTAAVMDPSVVTLPEERGKIGDRTHKYTLSTALSRKIGLAEPYFRAYYTIPVRGPQAYTNCSNLATGGVGLGTPGNCGIEGWDRKETGIKVPKVGGLAFGSEFTAYSPDGKDQKLLVDARALANFVSAGRYYNELSGVMRKLLATSDYVQFGGQVGVTARATDTFSLRASGLFLYNTDHALTDEKIGKDLNGNGAVDLDDNPAEINPNFDFRTDFVSRRFYVSESRTFRLDLQATFSF